MSVHAPKASGINLILILFDVVVITETLDLSLSLAFFTAFCQCHEDPDQDSLRTGFHRNHFLHNLNSWGETIKKKETSIFSLPSPSGSYVTLLPSSHAQLKTYLELLFLTDQLFGTSLADNRLMLLLQETGMNTKSKSFTYVKKFM